MLVTRQTIFFHNHLLLYLCLMSMLPPGYHLIMSTYVPGRYLSAVLLTGRVAPSHATDIIAVAELEFGVYINHSWKVCECNIFFQDMRMPYLDKSLAQFY